MNKEAAFDKLVEMYKNEKSHKFVIHLIHAFIPIQEKAQKILDNTEKRCCITNNKIISAQQQVELYFSLDKKNVFTSMIDPEAYNKLSQEINDKRGDREGGYFSSDTDKILSISGIQALHEFVLNKIMCGDYEINKIVSNKWKGFNK